MTDPLHPDGYCACGGEGRCEWCLSHCQSCGAGLDSAEAAAAAIATARREERERCREQALAAVNTGLRIARIDAEIATPMLGALDAAFDALGEP